MLARALAIGERLAASLPERQLNVSWFVEWPALKHAWRSRVCSDTIANGPKRTTPDGTVHRHPSQYPNVGARVQQESERDDDVCS
jgi:hypothetical protein